MSAPRRLPAAILAALASFMVAAQARAADLAVYTGGSMSAPLKAVGADFTRTTGQGLSFVSGTTGVMLKKIRAGEKADVIVISADGVEALRKEGRIAEGSIRPVASALLGVAVKAGAPKPDISTPDKFKAALLKARSVSYPDPALGATSGVYLETLFKQMGIAEAMKAKTVVKPIGADVAAAAATGEVELAITFISEMLPDRRIEVAGTLPAPILVPSPYVAGVSATAGDPAAARAFIDLIVSPAERGKLKAAGLDPAADEKLGLN